tara:strand:- start:233 stop:1183 length:951 start_codon:yes stop_codon:yes gene_type:complete
LKILFITSKKPEYQAEYLELTVLNGLRKILGENLVDYPRKKVAYGDFTEIDKNQLHGKGFTILRTPIKDIDRSEVFSTKYDAILYGTGHAVGEDYYIDEIDKLTDGQVWILDGHDLYGNAKIKKIYNNEEIIGNQFKFCFKRELVFDEETVFPTGYGIPEEVILPINLEIKNQLIQKTHPNFSNFETIRDLASGHKHHIFENEDEYYSDLSKSWFGLTCKKGGWDCMRHYEIIAAGSLLLFRDYENKPTNCSPQNLPTISYSTKKELKRIMKSLVRRNNPTQEYLDLLYKQRDWLLKTATTTARAKYILKIIEKHI